MEDNSPVIVKTPININYWIGKSHTPDAGGVVIFSGEVRNRNGGKEVHYLSYEAEINMAEKLIKQITNEAIKRWDLSFAVCIHRIGDLKICESAVLVITSHAHRKEAYASNQFIIDKVKHEVPIWKKEYYTDGTFSWGPQCNC